MARFDNVAVIQRDCLYALHPLMLRIPASCIAFTAARGIPLLTSAMARHAHEPLVQSSGLMVLSHLLGLPEHAAEVRHVFL